MLKSFENFMSLVDRKNLRSNAPKRHDCRLEILEERALLSAVPLSASEYADLRAQYADFNLSENMEDMNVIMLDLAGGDDLAALKSAITTASQTTQSDLIVVRTSTDASTLTYTANTDELTINIDSRQYGSVTIVGLGPQNLTLDANQLCRVMSITGSSLNGSPTIVNLGGVTIQNGTADKGGGIYSVGTLTISNSTVSGNTATSDGGGICNYYYATLKIITSEISGNTANYGGGIYNIYGNVTITNSGISENSSTLDGGGISNWHHGTMTITNSTLSGNSASCGGAIRNDYNSNLTITDSEISSNTASMNGGGIEGRSSSLTVISDCVITNNTASSNGGGIMIDFSSATVERSIISGNRTTNYSGGGIYTGSWSDFTITDTTISNNTSNKNGGGICNGTNCNLEITDSEISGNNASDHGGGIDNFSGVLTVINSTISGNTASDGGGIYNDSGTLAVTNSTIAENTASDGGGLNNNSGTLTVTNSTISGNTASRHGGGIYNSGYNGTGTLTVTNSTISGNTVSYGGGIFINSGTLTVTNSTISENTATYDGGGICSFSGTLTVTNSTISGNAASSNGGGIYNCRTMTVINSTISGNTASDGGGIYNDSETLTVTNSTISGNTASGSNGYGGGIYNDYGTITVNNSTISGNSVEKSGGGIHINHGSIIITTCVIYENTAAASGGGVNNDGGSVNVINCDINNNAGSGDGGGIRNVNKGIFVISSSTIKENTAGNVGGGIASNATITIINSSILNNGASQIGGGIYTDDGVLKVLNSLISGNTATGMAFGGGGIFTNLGTLEVTNSTIVNNTAVYGGGIYSHYSSATTKIYNSIIVCNSASQSGNDIYKSAGTISAYNSLSSYTAWSGSGNLAYNANLPLFSNVENGDYRLIKGSQAIDKGNNQYAFEAGMDETWTDIIGTDRFIGARVDLGAYEYFGFDVSQEKIYVGDVIISWVQYKNTANVRLTWVSGTTRTVLGTFGSVWEYTWDTTAFADGYGQMTVDYLDGNGKVILSSTVTGLILNDENVIVHRGEITGSETWSADKVHLVAEKVSLLSGASVTVEQNAVVKFWKNSFLNTNSGSTLTVQDNTVFTWVEDDTVAGDTNLDGSLSAPQFGNTYIRGNGTLNIAPSANMKYVIITTSGTISSNQIWLSGQVYRVTGDVTIARGATLTIQPGVVIKFDSGKSLIVQSGGTLNAQGTVAQPIVFTSVKDDSYGGDTNEDDGFYAPQAGDWNQIRVQGTAIFDHAIVRYTGSVSGSNGAIYLTSGSNLTFNNSVLEFSKYYALSSDSGTVNAQNSVFRESQTALVNLHSSSCRSRFTNCTFADSSMFLWCGWGDAKFTNCIVSNIASKFVGYGSGNPNSGAFTTCIFYNPKGSGPQSFSYANSNNNRWANPLFRNASAGDYYLMAGSPCIDAGTSTGAPETDITGVPRAQDPYSDRDGVVDIGAYEFVDGVSSSIDLEPVNVQAPASVTTGETVIIQWTIRNNGSAAAQGTWTDAVYLVNENSGQVVLVKEYKHAGSISPGDLQTFYTDVVIPTVTDGTWKVQLRANPNREIFEGVNVSNNAILAEAGTTVQTPFLTDSEGTITTKKNQPAIYRVTVQAGDSFNLQANSNKPVSIYMRENYVPSTSNYDFNATEYQANNYTLYIAPADTDRTFYLLAETAADAASVEYTIEAGNTFAILGITPTSVSNAGSSTLTVSGVGFIPGMTAELMLNDAIISASAVNVTTASSATLTFDLTSQPGGKYALRITSPNGQTDELADALTVEQNGIGAKLEIDLQLPESVRSGRVYEGKLLYTNNGDCDMLAPIFTIFSDTSAIALNSSDIGTGKSVYIIGLGSSDSAGILRAGESGYIPFYFKATDSSLISYETWLDRGELENDETWSTWSELFTDISDAVTQLGLRGVRDYSYGIAEDFARAKVTGQPSTGLSGTLSDSRNGNVLSNCTLEIVWTENNESRTDYVQTDENGFYAFNYLPQNTSFTLSLLSGAYNLSVESVTIGEDDITDFSLTALPYGTVSGRIVDQTTGSGISNVTVYAQHDEGNSRFAVTDEKGYFTIDQLELGTYSIVADSYISFLPVESKPVTLVNGTAQSMNFQVDPGAVISGKITNESNQPISGVSVYLTADSDKTCYTITDESGVYRFAGLDEGVVTIALGKNTYIQTEEVTINVPDHGKITQNYQLQAGASVSGQLVNANGQAVMNAYINVCDDNDDYWYARTDDSGFWSVDGLPNGNYTLAVYSQNYVFNQQTSFEITEVADSTLDIVYVATGTVTGQVTATNGLVGQGTLTISNGGMIYQAAETDQNGYYTFSDLIPGEYTLSFSDEYFCSVNVEANGFLTQNIELDVKASVSGTIQDTDGNSVSYAAIYIYQDGNRLTSVYADAEGTFNLAFEQTGTFDFYITTWDGRFYTTIENQVISNGDDLTLNFVEGTKSLAITNIAGLPDDLPDDAEITYILRRQNGAGEYIEYSCQDISASELPTFASLTTGTYLLIATCGNYSTEMEFTVAASDNAITSLLTFEQLAELTVTVMLPDGSELPIEETEVGIYNADNELLAGYYADENGQVVFNALENGEYTLVAFNGNYGAKKTLTINGFTEAASIALDILPVTITGTVVKEGQIVEDAYIEVTDENGIIVGFGYLNSASNQQVTILNVSQCKIHIIENNHIQQTYDVEIVNSNIDVGELEVNTTGIVSSWLFTNETPYSDIALASDFLTYVPWTTKGKYEQLRNYFNGIDISGLYKVSPPSTCTVNHPEFEEYNKGIQLINDGYREIVQYLYRMSDYVGQIDANLTDFCSGLAHVSADLFSLTSAMPAGLLSSLGLEAITQGVDTLLYSGRMQKERLRQGSLDFARDELQTQSLNAYTDFSINQIDKEIFRLSEIHEQSSHLLENAKTMANGYSTNFAYNNLKIEEKIAFLSRLRRTLEGAKFTLSAVIKLPSLYENAKKASSGGFGWVFTYTDATTWYIDTKLAIIKYESQVNKMRNTPLPNCTCRTQPPALKVNHITQSAISLIWQDLPGVTSYNVVCSTNGAFGQQKSVQGTSCTFTGLNADTRYHMKIQLVKPTGNSDWGGGCSARTPKASDPNEMIGPVGADFTWHDEGTEDEPFMVIDGANWIYSNELLENEYKIYFENKTSATAAAQEITVTTTLPQEMNWSTFQVEEIAIGNEIYTLTDDCRIGENTWLVDQASTGEQIKIRFDFDAETGQATWYLRSFVSSTYDNFPLSAYDGFLPPNDENHSGEGYITYHVKYDSDLVTGDVISTSASIVFDTNEAIETNVWLNTIDVDAPVSEITGYETSGDTVTLSWTGSDVGSGITAYDLYVSVNGGNFTLATGGLTETSYTYTFEEDGPHSFKVVATDAVGNTEVKAQSEITVTQGSLSQMITVLTTRETDLDSHVVSAMEAPISEWDDVYVEMWHAQGVSQEFVLEYNSTLYTLDAESCRTQEGVTLELGDDSVEAGMTTLTVSLDASNFVTNGANTLLASLKLTPVNPTNNLAVGESAEGIVWVDGDALATTVYSVIYDLNESGSIEINDLVAFARLFGQKTAENPDAWKADFNCDERVDISDLVLFARNFGLMTASSSQIRYDANYTPHVEEVQPAAPALPALETSVAWETPTWSGTTQNLVPEPAAALPTITDRAWNDLWSELEEEEEERLANQRKTTELAWF